MCWLQRPIKGLNVMSEDLNAMLSSLHNYQVRGVCERERARERGCVCVCVFVLWRAIKGLVV